MEKIKMLESQVGKSKKDEREQFESESDSEFE